MQMPGWPKATLFSTLPCPVYMVVHSRKKLVSRNRMELGQDLASYLWD